MRIVTTAVAAMATLAPGNRSADAQEAPVPCAAGRITNIFVDNHSIFDVDDMDAPASFQWVYRLANTLHVRTSDSFIRDELLFDEGECMDPVLLDESGRILRSYGFIAQADVFAVEQMDGTQHVVVDTRDEWTTKVDLGVSFDDGLHFETVEVTEENFLGRGILASAFLRRRKERNDRGVRLELPRVIGTRLDARVGVGRTRVGSFLNEALVYPFVGEVGRLGIRQIYRRRDELFPYALGEGAEYSHVLLELKDERAEASIAARIGEPGNLTLFGLGISREKLEFPGFPSGVEVARDNDFDNPVPAPGQLRERIAPQTRGASTTRINFLIGQRNLRFIRLRGLDALNGIQDLSLGTDVGLTLGRSLTVDPLSGGTLSSSGDLYTRLRVFAGHDPGTSYVFANLAVEGRQILSGGDGQTGWRDVLAEADVYGYIRSRRFPRQTFFARVSAAGAWSMETPYQLTLGGRDGVRGLHEEDVPAARRLVMTLEDRVFLGWPAPDVLDMGFTVFGDLGRTWAGEVPFGVTSDWYGTVGAGLRIGFPADSRGVARLDMAFPFGVPGRGSPVFRVTLYEPLGISTGFFDPQMERSRRISVGPDFFVQEHR